MSGGTKKPLDNKPIGPVKLALTFAGCFLGAGYVSGQELWHFFGEFGAWGLVGLVLALVLLGLCSVIVLRLAQKTGDEEIDKLIFSKEHPVGGIFPGFLEMLFLFSTATVMAAGAGAVLEQLFELPHWIGCALFTILVTILSFKGISGMVTVFEFSVPFLCLASVGLFVVAVAKNGFPAIPEPHGEIANPLLAWWPLSALVFTSYNIFASIAILAPVGLRVPNSKTDRRGVIMGTGLLLLIAFSVLFSIFSDPVSLETEMPMLKTASDIHPYLGFAYSQALVIAMLGTSLSCFVAAVEYMSIKIAKTHAKHPGIIAFCSVTMFLGSLVGFGDLISVVYPLFGYLSAGLVVLMVIHYVKVRKAPARAEAVTENTEDAENTAEEGAVPEESVEISAAVEE